MSKMLAYYDHLPEKVQSALTDFKQLLHEIDGKTLAIPCDDGCFIDDGVIVVDDCLTDAFNTIVAALSGEGQP